MTANEIDRRIARRVWAALRESHLTYDEVAQACGLSRRSLHRRVAGEREFYVPELVRIGALLGQQPDRFVGRILSDATPR
jgi:AraC-like DNA-binding protein